MEIMGRNTAEKWFDRNTRIFQKIDEDIEDVPFYEVNKRKNATIDFDEEDALAGKEEILRVNREKGHFILDKRVDVKSADDYQGKIDGGERSSFGNQP